MKTSEDLPEINDFDLNIDFDENKNIQTKSQAEKATNKIGYYDRKLENRLKKYESYLKKNENINRIDTESQFLFVGNGGLENNISQGFLEATFEKFGKLVDVLMPKKKSYAFVIYEDKQSTIRAIEKLQAQVITENQTPICFYMFPVDKVPESDESQIEYGDLPPGLIYLPNYIDSSYAEKLVEFLIRTNDQDESSSFIDLKKRKVKHFGYEFRYGTNDCDVNKPLTEPEKRMPELCNELISRMVSDGLVSVPPDQLTVNFYEPGHGIGPHVDNVKAFDDYIISLSLISSVLMEFKHSTRNTPQSKLLLEPNSLLVLKGESRYEWTHGISERKHDILTDSNGQIEVRARQKRISLTFRKVKEVRSSEAAATTAATEKVELILPKTDQEAADFERTHVHTVYNQIASHFSQTRYSAWPGVSNFLSSMSPYSSLLDVGCGNGKYLGIRKDVYCFGCDYSDQLIQICQERSFNCFVSDCLKLPCKDDYFEYLICIAVLHHLSTDERRIRAIVEMNRVLKKGGRALITVWAKEQKYKEKESFYISANKKSTATKMDETSESSSNVHTFGKEFEKKDVFVAWRLKPESSKKDKRKKEQETAAKQSVDDVSTKNSDGDKQAASNVYLRFYHVFEQNELEKLFESIPGTKIVESFYEQGNWCVIFEKC